MAFRENEVVDRVGPEVTERDDLMPYQMFMVREGQKRAFFDRCVYGLTELGIIDKQILLEVKTLRRSNRAAKKRMFRAMEREGGVVFGPFINYALLMMVANSIGDNGMITGIRYDDLLVVRITMAVFELIVHDMDRILRPGCLGMLKTLFGVDLQALILRWTH